MRFLPLLLFLFSFEFISAQTKIVPPRKVSCDCDSAIVLQIGKIAQYGVTVPPPNAGKKNEITRTTSNPNVFENEHHTAWYVFVPLSAGELTLTILPEIPSDDYDFVIYRYYGKSTCDSVASGKAKPIRSNIARSQNISGGQTGIAADGKSEFAGEGPGKAFSKILRVKKGEKYLLVVDNVYEKGGGHTLKFAFMRDVNLAGVVSDENGKHLKANITMYDDSGKVIAETKSDSSGKYKMQAAINDLQNYSIVMSTDSTFPQVVVFTTKWSEAKKKYVFTTNLNTLETDSLPKLQTVLLQLKEGKKYNFATINFFSNQAIVLPESKSSLRSLYVMMEKNPNLKIRIEGHVNGVDLSGNVNENDTATYRQLSEARAQCVYNYLIERGIAPSRLSWIGYGDRFMLFPKAKNDEQRKMNRRVEISVVEF